MISWTHGTTGMADACAPSRDNPDFTEHHYTELADRVLDTWVQNGFAVVQTDYEGLGTPGVAPYLIGRSEARSAIDIVLAARQLDPAIGRRWLVMGHSQSGHAALFTAAIASQWAPNLRLIGSVALAPSSGAEQL